jgi:hypothetical protein
LERMKVISSEREAQCKVHHLLSKNMDVYCVRTNKFTPLSPNIIVIIV